MGDTTPTMRPTESPGTGKASQSDRYTHGHGEQMLRLQGQRTAEQDASPLLPHLRPGMRILDFGCGVGSITLGLAVAVAPGEAVGIDIEPATVARARALADELGVTNVRFEQGDVYALPFAAATFDAAFSRSVLEHLARPLEALREVRRVLKPGGVIGLTEGDFGGYVFAPHRPLVAEAVALYLRAWEHNGGNPRRGRELRALLREAGFGRVEATAGTPEVKGTPAATRECGELVAGLLTRPTFVDQMNRLGWADRQRLDQMAAALREWGEHPDAFWAVLRCKAIGRAE